MADERKDPDYLGDGVYAWHDGYHVWLTTGHHFSPPRVALEPRVLRALVDYAKRVGLPTENL